MTNDVPQIAQQLPQVITASFNLYHMLFASLGGAGTWHLILKHAPDIQAYCDSRVGGILPALFHVLVGKPQTTPGPAKPVPGVVAPGS